MEFKVYFNSADLAGFNTDNKLPNAIRRLKRRTDNKASNKSLANIQAWLQSLDAYTIHKTFRRKFARELYVETNLIDVERPIY
jgi:hypothetical protein